MVKEQGQAALNNTQGVKKGLKEEEAFFCTT